MQYTLYIRYIQCMYTNCLYYIHTVSVYAVHAVICIHRLSTCMPVYILYIYIYYDFIQFQFWASFYLPNGSSLYSNIFQHFIDQALFGIWRYSLMEKKAKCKEKLPLPYASVVLFLSCQENPSAQCCFFRQLHYIFLPWMYELGTEVFGGLCP